MSPCQNNNVLRRDRHLFNILKAQPEKRLPCILSREEVIRILQQVKTFHNYACLTTIYSCGLRLQEGLFLQVSDIDSHRMLIHVHRGKGAKDRFVPLPGKLLDLLRKYWKTHRPSPPDLSGFGPGPRQDTTELPLIWVVNSVRLP